MFAKPEPTFLIVSLSVVQVGVLVLELHKGPPPVDSVFVQS